MSAVEHRGLRHRRTGPREGRLLEPGCRQWFGWLRHAPATPRPEPSILEGSETYNENRARTGQTLLSHAR